MKLLVKKCCTGVGSLWVFWAIAAIACSGSCVQAQSLSSPWDGKAVALTSSSYDLSVAPAFQADLDADDYYSDPHNSIIDPAKRAAEQKAVADADAAVEQVLRAADDYQSTGSRAAAEYSAQMLNTAAQSNFLGGTITGSESHYVQGWLAGAMAVAYLKVRPSGLVTADESSVIEGWLKGVAAQSIAFFDPGGKNPPVHSLNNHRYWAGFEVCAIGIAANDSDLYTWGIQSAKVGIDQIASDGTLPLEMNREAMALHYHLFAAAPLVMLAEFGMDNGADLYSYDGGALHRLAARAAGGIVDPSYFQKATGVAQIMPAPDAQDVAWLQPYLDRFPDPSLAPLLSKPHSLSSIYLGGLPPR